MKKTILIVTSEFPPQPGGIGNHAFNLALHLAKQKFDVSVIADQRSDTGEEEVCFDKGLPFSVLRVKRHNLRLRMYVKRFEVTRKQFGNVSHVIATGKFSLWNVAFCNLFRKRFIMAVVHGSEVNFKPFGLRKSINIALKQFNTVVAVSNYTKGLIAHLNCPVRVIPNGINLENWQLKNTEKMELKGSPRITTVGRVSSRKGQLNVIRQLPSLTKHYPQIHYHCVGIPTEASDFMKIAKSLSVESHVTFHGAVNQKTLKAIVSKTDIFVMLSSESSTGDVEGFGIAILEANALGVPAIGATGCGIEDAINPKTSGLLIDPKEGVLFKNAITSILQHKIDYQKGAKEWAEMHDWTKIVKCYVNLLR